MSSAIALMLVALASTTSLEGSLVSVGSDSMSPVMTQWARMLKERHPAVSVSLHSTGSAGAPAALLEGTAAIGAMSRPMSDAEQRALRKRHGARLRAVVVGIDAIAVVVHPANEIEALSLTQLDAMYSLTRHCGGTAPIRDWTDVASAESAAGAIRILGRNASSGTYEFFRQRALCGGFYAPSMREYAGSGGIVFRVQRDRQAIGYVASGYVNERVKTIPVRVSAESAAFPATAEHSASGRYPLARELYVYYLLDLDGKTPKVVSAFLAIALSPHGQQQLMLEGFFALPDTIRLNQLAIIR